ncbi:MAG: prenyltransferase [Pyrinomonadaceae bacterium]
MSDFLLLIRISRPRFWIYVLGPFLIGLAAAFRVSGELAHWHILILGIYFTLPANLLIYGINDIFDYETDRRNPKKENFEALVEPDRHNRLFFYIAVINIPFLLAAAYLGSLLVGISLSCFLLFSVFYSAPPVRSKSKPLLDSAFNILYVFPGVTAFALIRDDFPPIPVLLAAGLWTMAMHAYSAIPDIEADKEAGIQTVATFLSAKPALLFCTICYLAAAVLSFSPLGFFALVFGTVYISMMAASMYASGRTGLFSIYRKFPIVNTIVGFCIFWIIAFPKIFK